MRKLCISLVLIWAASLSQAFEIEDQSGFGSPDAGTVLRIISTADIGFFQPTIQSYLQEHPDTYIDYTVASSTELMRAIYDESAPFDLAISSAMDLQTKLANDGKARQHTPDLDQELPDWAVWNDMVFAFTQEPAAMVLSVEAFRGLDTPQNRQQLIATLRQNPERFRGKLGTYDIRMSGLGYLFATQDTRASETYWRLTEVMGGLDAQLFCCSSDMIDAVERGDLAVAYNVLGSYAVNRGDSDRFTIVLPSDFTTVMLRTVLIPRTAENPKSAERFVDHMLAQAFAGSESNRLGRFPLDPTTEAALHRIRLGPGLLVFLDGLKKRAFLQEWENAILQE